MTEQTYKILNPTETIINSIPSIIEAFVTFYGESERENIIQKFTNMLVIGYARPDHISATIRKSNTEQNDKLIKELLDKLSENEDEHLKIKNLLLGDYNLEFDNLHPIKKYIDYKNGNNISDYHKKDVVNFLKQINSETTIDNIDELIKQGKFKNLNMIITVYEEIISKYQQYSLEIKPYKDYVDKCQNLRNNLEKVYQKELIENIKDLFTEDEYKQIQEAFKDKRLVLIKNINGKTKNYLSYSLYGIPLIASFSKENEDILINGTNWRKDSIKKDRIEYFKNLGFDLGDNYDSYINHPDVKKIIPSIEIVERVLSETNNMYNKMINEYYTSITEYQKNRARIEKENLLDKEDEYSANAYENNSTAITTNLKLIDGKYVEYPILFLYMGLMEEYYDKDLIHELNHVYELKLQNVQDNYYQMICGWDLVDGNINNEINKDVKLDKIVEKRNYELFNEIINELISQEICEILSQSDIYIFNTKENKKIKGGTSYERTVFIVKKFYETYKKEIIESRKNGKITLLFDVVGKENFEDFNQLFHEYYENFNEFEIHQAYKDLEKGIETEKTRKLKEIYYKRDQILTKMEEHSFKSKKSI